MSQEKDKRCSIKEIKAFGGGRGGRIDGSKLLSEVSNTNTYMHSYVMLVVKSNFELFYFSEQSHIFFFVIVVQILRNKRYIE
jgi:hypothetical protein